MIKGMVRLNVVLVEPRYPGNVGAVARVVANFGLSRLTLVRPCPLGEEARQRAMHAERILMDARIVETLDEATRDADLAVGTTAAPTGSEEAFHRQAIPPWELAAQMRGTKGVVALVLGREDDGLSNEELGQLDLLVHIPADPGYPVLNLSHAAAILLYELCREAAEPAASWRRLASGFEKEKLHEAFHEFLVETGYPVHRRRRTEVLFRRLVGRALPTKWEFHALMGAFRGATKAFRRQAGEERDAGRKGIVGG